MTCHEEHGNTKQECASSVESNLLDLPVSNLKEHSQFSHDSMANKYQILFLNELVKFGYFQSWVRILHQYIISKDVFWMPIFKIFLLPPGAPPLDPAMGLHPWTPQWGLAWIACKAKPCKFFCTKFKDTCTNLFCQANWSWDYLWAF